MLCTLYLWYEKLTFCCLFWTRDFHTIFINETQNVNDWAMSADQLSFQRRWVEVVKKIILCPYWSFWYTLTFLLSMLYLQHALAIHSTECILASFALLTRALSFDVVSKNMKCIFPFVASKLVRYQSFVLGCQVSK